MSFVLELFDLPSYVYHDTLAFELDILLEQGSPLKFEHFPGEYQLCFYGVSNSRPFMSRSETIITAPWRKKEYPHF